METLRGVGDADTSAATTSTASTTMTACARSDWVRVLELVRAGIMPVLVSLGAHGDGVDELRFSHLTYLNTAGATWIRAPTSSSRITC